MDAQRDPVALDANIMEAIAQGDTDALSAVMQREGPRLVRLANSLLSSESETEDVLQDAYLQLWRVAGEWQASARIGTWLHTIVYRACIDRLRRRRPTLDIATVEDTLTDPQPDAEQHLMTQNRKDQVRKAIDLLAPRQKTAVLLAYHEELSQAEASGVLGLSEEAYESLLARARRRLRSLLVQREETPDDRA